VVYRSAAERSSNPERLNLDRRHLTCCPILKHEDRVRLLNYQNNYIENIAQLHNLPNLIFLDLYNNCIEVMSSELGSVPTLRVLMLGKVSGWGVCCYDFLLLPVAPSVSCSWLDALNTPSSKLPLSPAFCNPSKLHIVYSSPPIPRTGYGSYRTSTS
jgi:Leucine-rich repeat (LRR) protein